MGPTIMKAAATETAAMRTAITETVAIEVAATEATTIGAVNTEATTIIGAVDTEALATCVAETYSDRIFFVNKFFREEFFFV